MEWILANSEIVLLFGSIALIAVVVLAVYKYMKLEQITVKKKKIKTSAWVIPFVIFSLFSFTGVAIYVQIRTGIELSPTLITCFFAFCTGELWMLASIKKSKLKNGDSAVKSIMDSLVHKDDSEESEG
jgi:hypothetical protein